MESGTAEGPAVSSAAATGAQWLATLIRTRQQLSPKRLRARCYCPSPMCCAITDGKCALAPPAPFRLCRKL